MFVPRSPLGLNRSCILMLKVPQRTTVVGISWDVFVKRILVEQTFSVSCAKIQGVTSPLPTPIGSGCNELEFLLLHVFVLLTGQLIGSWSAWRVKTRFAYFIYYFKVVSRMPWNLKMFLTDSAKIILWLNNIFQPWRSQKFWLGGAQNEKNLRRYFDDVFRWRKGDDATEMTS